MNYVQIVGKVAKPMINKQMKNSNYSMIELAVKSNFRDAHGGFRDDIFEVFMWRGMKVELIEATEIGSWVSLKGRLELMDGHLRIIAEQLEVFGH